MSERPKDSREEQPEDLLEQIITQGLDKLNAPAQAAGTDDPPETAPSAPKAENGAGTARTADRKDKRTAVYFCLMLLFSAAFLMLLPAYFVQRRSSEAAISELRDSMNLSREGLLFEISANETRITALNEENKALRAQLDRLDEKNARLNRELTKWLPQYDTASPEAIDAFFDNYYAAQDELSAWSTFWELEQNYQAGNYESCAALLLMEGFSCQIPESAAERHDEIVQAVVSQGLLDEIYYLHVSDYEDLISAYLNRQTND